MYNGTGLQTPRGSGTDEYIQTNKFSVKPKISKVAKNTKGFEASNPNKDKLIDQGYTDIEIAEKLEETRQNFEAATATEETGGPVSASDKKVLDTQTRQIAARKEKQVEALKAAPGHTHS